MDFWLIRVNGKTTWWMDSDNMFRKANKGMKENSKKEKNMDME